MSRINKLELRYYDNINRHLQKPELWDAELTQYKAESIFIYKDEVNVSKHARNFYEYYIDGEMLINKIGAFYDNEIERNDYTSSFDHEVGNIGLFGNYAYNKLLIKRLMLDRIGYKEISDYCLDIENLRPSEMPKWIENIKENLEDTFLLYVCQECGDRDCGGTGVEISKRKGCYFWTIGASDKKLQFCFEYNQYRNALFRCLNEIRRRELANSLLTNRK